ncbi:CBS domain-containing protein [Rugosimonospora africana]|nr:CBS domain-containing protein [Rugosimonospora africana]
MKRWRVVDVMTTAVVSVGADTGYKRIADLLVARGISAVPVVDPDGVVLGVVSESDLLPKLNYPDRVGRHPLLSRRRDTIRRALGDTAADLMSSPATTIRPDASIARAARLMEAARVKRLPVVDDADRLVGIVSRRDLVRPYARPDSDIRADVITHLVSGFWIDPSTVEARVVAGVVTLTGHVDRTSTRHIVVNATHTVPGVVDVVDQLTADIDDDAATRTGWYRGHLFSAEPRDIARSPR